MKKTWMLGALCASALPGLVQGADELDAVVVTATRYPTALVQATGQVAVVTEGEFARRNITRLSDIVNVVPGLAVQPGRGALQGTQALSLRGVPDERRLLLLIDGIPMNDGYAGSVNLAGMGVQGVTRAEVLVGPTSSLYGGSAMSGVVSFSTRMPERDEFTFSVGYGQPFTAGKAPENVQRAGFSAGTRFESGLSLQVGGNWMATDGYRNEGVTTTTQPGAALTGWQLITAPPASANYLIGWKGAVPWQENGQFVKAEQSLGGGARMHAAWRRQAYVSGSTVDSETLLTTVATGLPSRGGNDVSYLTGMSAYERQVFSFGSEFGVADGVLKWTAAYMDVPVNFVVSPITTVTGRINNTTSSSRLFDGHWQGQQGAHGLALGLSWREDRARAVDNNLSGWLDDGSISSLYATASGKTRTLGLFVQDEWSVAERWIAQLGLRFDDWRNYEGSVATPGWPSGQIFRDYPTRNHSALSPKVGLNYRLNTDTIFRTSWGSAFRAPSVYELYRSSRIGTTFYNANPDLKPETITTFDLGLDYRPWRGADFKATLFENRMSDLIYTGPTYFVAGVRNRDRINAEAAESRGITMSLAQKLFGQWQANASYTLTHSKVLKNSLSVASEGKRLTSLPKHQATFGISWENSTWSLAANTRYASKQYSEDDNSDVLSGVPRSYDAYVLTEVKASYRIDRNFTASLAVDNLFDRAYFSFYQAPGRNWFASLAYRY